MFKIVYYIMSPSKNEEVLMQWSTKSDRLYAQKYKRQLRSRQSFLGRSLLRMAYAELTNSHPCDLVIDVIESGALKLSDPFSERALFGSISHSDDCICVIVGDESPVGIDVEHQKTERDIATLLSAISSTDQYEYFSKHREQAYCLWTLNEAYGKAMGTGLPIPIPSKIIEHSKTYRPQKTLYEHLSNTIFMTFEFDDYMVSICLSSCHDTETRRGPAVLK